MPLPAANTSSGAALRYIALGGGPTPEYTEVSLEQDLELASRALPGPGVLLFAGGTGSDTVRILGPDSGKPSLLAELGDVFDPRGARSTRYRRTTLNALPASLDNFEQIFSEALRSGDDPLLVYIAAHGMQGQEPRDNYVETWGGEALDVLRVDELEGDSTRPVRFIIASCYSGGFGELAFHEADREHATATQLPRCGLFAGTWDRETSGCDPNPDRRAQEGYSIHMLHALRGEDREGHRLPLAQLDLDGDGQISLLEAHTRARIASRSIDVPTTTSEVFLREVEHHEATPNFKLLPEDAAVVQQLGARLHLTSRAAVKKRYTELSAKLKALQDDSDAAADDLDRAQRRLSALLLARWPGLDDPYRDDFASTVHDNAAAIAAVLHDSPQVREYERARKHADALSEREAALDPDEAMVLRLVRAYETLSLRAALEARGGPQLQQYKALLACERGLP